MLSELFETFVREKIYLENVSPKTVTFYWSSWKVSQKHLPKQVSELNEKALKDLVIALRQLGQKPKSVNTYISALNSFLSWLKVEEHTEQHFKIKKLKLEQTIYRIFNETHIRMIMNFRPGDFFEHRLWCAICLLLDTGIRLEECLTLVEEDINFDQFLFIVRGKGNKERYVPFSDKMRKILVRYLKEKTKQDITCPLVFSTTTNNRITQRNFQRDMKALCARLRITGVRASPHTLRHSHAIWYLMNGGDLYTLSRCLGHSSISVTEIYLRSMGMDLVQKRHQNFTPLVRY